MSSAVPADLRGLAVSGADLVARLEESGDGSHEHRVDVSRAALRWAADTFRDDLTVATSMGDEVLVHLVGTTIPGADVFFLDTGYHFAETLETRDAYATTLPLRLRTIRPALSVAEQDVLHGARLYARNADACCAMRKVEPLRRALVGYRAWVTGMRRDDAPSRTDIDLIGWDARRELVKLNPIAAWSQADVDRYVDDHDVLLNPLRRAGYTSIGCAPCTRPVAAGEDPRAGRWSGQAKTECGLHT